jgi:predicted MFS family arabinose efflux permease
LVIVMVELFDTDHLTLEKLTILTAFYIGYRRVAGLVLSPVAGMVADRVGLERIFAFSVFLTACSLVLILAGLPGAGLVCAFTFQSVSASLSPAAAGGTDSDLLKSVAVNATWRDLGAATGALMGGLLLKGGHLHLFLLVGTVLLFLFFVKHMKMKKQFKLPVLWR